MRLDLHLHLFPELAQIHAWKWLAENRSTPCSTPSYHLQCTPQNSTENIGKPQLILSPSVIGQLNEIRQRVLFKYERELVVVTRPVGDRGRDVEEDPEPNLQLA